MRRASRLPELPARYRSVVLLAVLALSGTSYVACGSTEDRSYGNGSIDGTGGDTGDTGGSAGNSSGNGGSGGGQSGNGGQNQGGTGGTGAGGESGGTAGQGGDIGSGGTGTIRDSSDDGPLSNTR